MEAVVAIRTMRLEAEERRGHCCSANYDYDDDYGKMEARLRSSGEERSERQLFKS